MLFTFSYSFARKIFFLLALVCLIVSAQAYADPSLGWNTFVGGSGQHLGYGVTYDAAGNVYGVGLTNTTWNTGMFGSPVRAFGGAGYTDGVVFKLNKTGALQWYTFLGVATGDASTRIVTDNLGFIYVIGYTTGSWGTPLHAFNGGDLDAFVAKINASTGAIVWNTFLGGSSNDYPWAIALDGDGNIYVGGETYRTFHSSFNNVIGTNKSSDGYDGFLMKLNSDGAYQWHRYFTPYPLYDIAIDTNNNIYTVKRGYYYSGIWYYPAEVGKYTTAGAQTWLVQVANTTTQDGFGIAVDTSGNVFVKGSISASWGSPVRSYSGGTDTYVAKLNPSNGAVVWHTFLGGGGTDTTGGSQGKGGGLSTDFAGNIYVSGYSSATWGSPVLPFVGGDYDGYVAKLNSDGSLSWNLFLGGSNADAFYSGTGDPSGDIYVTGYTQQNSWGPPINFPTGCYYCESVAKIENSVTHVPTMVGMANTTVTPGGPITLTGTCYDGDTGDTLNVSVAQTSGTSCGEITGSSASGTGGVVTLAASCTAPAGASTMVFTFTCNDGTTTVTDRSTLYGNTVPVANAQSLSTNEDVALAITLTGSDAEGSALTYSVVTNPAHGTLSGSGASRTFTPTANYNGSDSFTFKANDGTLDSATATISITINPINDAPTATAQSQTTPEDTPKAITLSGTDVEGSALSYTIVTSPAHGALSGTPPSVTYTPAANYYGSDSFTFKVNDGTVDSSNATVSLTVTTVNDAPVANNQSVSTNEDTAFSITMTGSDVEGSALTYTVVTSTTNGTLSGTGASRTYTPNANFNGSDSFTFRVNDGSLNSVTNATVSITVNPVNDAPTANAQSVTTDEDVPASITLTGSDIEGSALTFEIIASPSHGAVSSGSGASRTYTPAANYNGSDSFTFRVNDGSANSSTATVSITINVVNDAPVATAQSQTTSEDTPVMITLSGTDAESSPLTYTVVASPAHGVLSGTPPEVTYTPAANYNGADSFSFKANDGTIDSVSTATVSLTITPVNDSPTATAQSVTTNEDEGVEITLTGSDIDGDSLSYTVITQPVHGDLSGTAPDLTFTPDEGYYGSDSFTFRVNDGTVNSLTATVSITVAIGAHVPWAESMTSYEVYEGETIDLFGMCTDDYLEGSLTGILSQISGTSCGLDAYSVTEETGGFVELRTTCVAPNVTVDTELIFRVRCNDGSDIDDATFTVSVNAAPTALPQSVSVDKNSSNNEITLTGSDPSDETLIFSLVSSPTHGTLSGTIPNYRYTPQRGYHGTDSFTFRAHDGSQYSASATISITINNHNEAPVIADEVGVEVECSTDCTLPDWSIEDPDGESVDGEWVQISGTDTLEFNNDGSIDLDTHPARGTYIVQYVATDGIAETSSEPVTLTLPNNEPIIEDVEIVSVDNPAEEFSGEEYVRELQLNVFSLDYDNDILTYTWDSNVDDSDLVDLSACDSDTCDIIIRMAGTITLTITTEDGYGGTTEQVVELYIPPPELSTEDVSITLVETVYRRADVVSIRGTLLSPVWPVIIFNNHMIGDINLSESNVSVSRSSSRADDETTYDLYEFTAENITLNTEGDPLVATVYTDVDGNLMRIAPETSLLVQQGGDNGADNNGDTSGLALGASWGCAFHTNATGHFYDCWTLLILVAALYGVKKFRFSG